MTIFSPHLSFILSITLSFSFLFSLILSSFDHHLLLRSFLGFSGGLGLITAIVLSIVKKQPHPVNITDAPCHDVGLLVPHGLASCTEILGFECSDEIRLMEQLDNRPSVDSCLTGKAADIGAEICSRTSHRVRTEARSFPPPLSSLNVNGQPSFFLRPVRKDGRLKLTEVRIHRPEILHAWRHDGRLTLHLIPEGSSLDDSEDDREEEELLVEEEVLEKEEEEELLEEEDEEEFRLGDWKFGNEGLRRCHQELNDHGHRLHSHHLQLRVPGLGIA